VVIRIFQTTEIGAPADDVWRIAGRPELISEFHPDVVTATLDGDVRTSLLVDGSLLVERIVERSIVHRFYTYELIGGAPALSSLRGCLGVRGHGDHSHLDWDVELVADRSADARDLACALDQKYCEALDRLRAQLERSVAAA
jgi:hypothetical protein